MAEAQVPFKKQDKNRPVRLRYTKTQAGWKTISNGGNAPDKLVIVYQGKNVEIPFGDETDLMMPFRVAQHYIAKQKNWSMDGKTPGNGGILEIVELNAVKSARKASEEVFDLETADYETMKAKAKELGIELPGNVSKADLTAKLKSALAAK